MARSSRPNYKHVIIHQTDTLADIIYSIQQTEGEPLLIYLPEQMHILSQVVNARILKRELEKEDKEVVFCTSNSSVGRVLRSQGLTVDLSASPYEDEEEPASTASAASDPLASFFDETDRGQATADSGEQTQVSSYAGPRSKPWYAHFGAIAGGVIAGVLLAVALVIFYVPQATVTVSFGGKQLKKEYKVTFDPSQKKADAQKLIMPGTLHTKTGQVSQTFETTGKATENVKTELRITIKNEKNSEQQLVERTRFRNSQGQIYRTVRGVTVPAGGEVSVNVVADRPGYTYDMESGVRLDIVNLATERVYGTTEKVVRSGSKKGAVFVSGKDVGQAKDTLKQKLSQKLTKKVEKSKSEEIVVLNSAQLFRNTSFRNLPEAGTLTETFRPTLKADLSFMTYNEAELISILRKQVSKQLTKEERLADSVSLSFSDPLGETAKLEDGVKLRVFFKYMTHGTFNKSQVSKDLTGKTFTEVRSYMQKFSNAEEVNVELSPKVWPRMPLLKKNITIKTQSL